MFLIPSLFYEKTSSATSREFIVTCKKIWIHRDLNSKSKGHLCRLNCYCTGRAGRQQVWMTDIRMLGYVGSPAWFISTSNSTGDRCNRGPRSAGRGAQQQIQQREHLHPPPETVPTISKLRIMHVLRHFGKTSRWRCFNINEYFQNIVNSSVEKRTSGGCGVTTWPSLATNYVEQDTIGQVGLILNGLRTQLCYWVIDKYKRKCG